MKRFLSLLLAAVLAAMCLTGCSFGKKSESTKAGLYYRASGIGPDEVLLTVDGWDVTADRYFYWLTSTCDYISSYYEKAGKTVDWSENHNGQSLAQYAQQQALSNTALYAEIESWAKKYGCEVTQDDLNGISTEWDTKAQEYGGEEPYLAKLAYMGIDKATAQLISADFYLYNHLYEKFCDKDSELYPNQADLDSYAKENSFLTVDDILISTADVTAGDTAALAKKKQQAQVLLSTISASSSPLTTFADLADQYSQESSRSDYPDGFTFAPGTGVMPDAFEKAALALKENGISGVVETDKGYYIILRKQLDMDTVGSNYFDHELQTAAQNAKIDYSDSYQKIDVADFYEKLTEARSKLENPAPVADSSASGGDTSAQTALPGAAGDAGGLPSAASSAG
jgi:Parvulin-like peptidyl-prolyl isomerase